MDECYITVFKVQDEDCTWEVGSFGMDMGTEPQADQSYRIGATDYRIGSVNWDEDDEVYYIVFISPSTEQQAVDDIDSDATVYELGEGVEEVVVTEVVDYY